MRDRSLALWMLGYPQAALADIETVLKDAREIGHAVTRLHSLGLISLTNILRRDYASASSQVNELAALADAKGSLFWKVHGILQRGSLLALAGQSADAIQLITSAITELRSTGATGIVPLYLGYLAGAYAKLGQFGDARRAIDEAITAVETTKERWWEAHLYRMAGEIALMSPEPDTAKAEAYFARALAVARKQQAKSWELRAAMSMARLKRDQGKRDEARALLASVYGWFTEGFDTLDLKEAKALLDELAS